MAVCSINYIGKNYNEADALHVAALHEQVEFSLIKVGKGVIKKGFSESKNFRPTSYSTDTYKKVLDVVGRVNSMYDGKVVEIKKDVKGRNYLTVNVNPIASKNLYHIKNSIQQKEEGFYDERNGEVLNKADYDYEKRVTNFQADSMTLDNLVEQIRVMEQKFKKAGISVAVILDGDIKTSGAVLSQSNPTRMGMVEDGTITEDGFVIVLNPNLLAQDTLLHEFGHIFIDLIGGHTNPKIIAAYQKLQGTEVYKTVQRLYPELTIDSPTFIKEVVNTALGKRATEIFSNKDNQSWWTRFTDWLYETVGKLFGSNKDVIQDLAKDLLEVQNMTLGEQVVVNTEDYFHKLDPTVTAVQDQISNNINSINAANQVIYSDIILLIKSFERRTGQKVDEKFVKGKGEDSEEKKLYKLKQLAEKFKKIKNGEEQKFLLEFTSEITETANKFKDRLDMLVNALNTGASYNIDSRLKMIRLVKEYTNLFSIAENILADINYMGLTGANKVLVEDALTKAVEKKQGIMRNLVDLGIDLLVETQAGNFDKIRVEYRDRYRTEYDQTKDMPITEVMVGETRDAFVDRKLTDIQDQILEETKFYLRKQFRESLDISYMNMVIDSEKDINSTSITILSKILDQADFNRNNAFLPSLYEAQQVHTTYSSQYNSSDMKKMYDSLLQITSKSSYLLGEYKAEFYETFFDFVDKEKKLEQAVDDEVDPVKKKLIQSELTKARAARKKWFKANTREVEVSPTEKSNIPVDSWKDPRYAKIKSNPDSAETKMLEFLEKVNDKADENTKGFKSLNRRIDGVETVFRRLPALGKDNLERLASGQISEEGKDMFQRLFKRTKDDDTVGDTGEEADIDLASKGFPSVRIVRGTFAGEERHLVPIHFRHTFDNKINSYDLMTIYMMNLFMSENFKAKSDMQPLAELLVDVNSAKKTITTVDIQKVAKAYFIDKGMLKATRETDTSNEQAKLTSMLENRLYGIKTIDNQFGKVAETVMAWTGTTMLALNFYSGLSNVVQGKVMNFIEAHSQEFFTKKELAKGESKFFGDMDRWIRDIGAITPTSKTRRFLDIFDPQGDFKGISQRYIRSNRLKGVMSRSSLSFPNSMGEMYVQGTLMYSILSKIKPMDKDGNYFDLNLRPTKDVSKAISLDEVITLNEDGTYSLPKEVHSTTFSVTAQGNHDKIFLETKNLVKKVTSDLHGQYDDELQSHAQRTVIGKAFFMLRKWIMPGVNRRYRGMVHALGKDWTDFDQIDNEDFRVKRFYSEDTKSFREGTYTTMIRFTRQLIKEGELAKLFIASKTKAWNKLTDHERANFRRFTMEFAVIALTLVSAWILKGLGEELPEDEAQAVFLAAYTFRRLHQELVAYANPVEALQLMRSPMASISMIENAIQLVGRVTYDGVNVVMGNEAEVYQTGRRKGELKIAKEFKDVFPILSQSNRNLEDVMEYTFKTY